MSDERSGGTEAEAPAQPVEPAPEAPGEEAKLGSATVGTVGSNLPCASMGCVFTMGSVGSSGAALAPGASSTLLGASAPPGPPQNVAASSVGTVGSALPCGTVMSVATLGTSGSLGASTRLGGAPAGFAGCAPCIWLCAYAAVPPPIPQSCSAPPHTLASLAQPRPMLGSTYLGPVGPATVHLCGIACQCAPCGSVAPYSSGSFAGASMGVSTPLGAPGPCMNSAPVGTQFTALCVPY